MSFLSGLAPRRQLFLLGWGCGLCLIYLALGGLAVSTVRGERVASTQAHILRMTPGMVEPGLTPPDPIPATGDFVPVELGLYLDSVEALSIRDSNWTATFYVWFRWQGDRAIDPGAHFRLVDGRIDRKELVDEHRGADGSNYQRFRIAARLTKFFNTTRVPLDNHQLNIYLEDAQRDASRLRYLVHPDSNVSSRIRIPGYDITGHAAVVKPHTYRSAYGDPRFGSGHHSTYTMFTFGLEIQRHGLGVYVKIFIGLFAGMALAITSFALRASDAGPRFSMLGGAYFGAVANSYLSGSLIPSSGQFGLVEYVTFLGLFTIFLSLISTIVSAYIWNILADKDFSRRFDLVTISAIATAYVAINIALPLSA